MSEVKKIKPALSKGTRDFLPAEVAKRNYIFNTIKSVFRKYGFEEIETPAIERLETLTGKYGEEGDKLLFKILNSGDFLDVMNDYAKKNLEQPRPLDYFQSTKTTEANKQYYFSFSTTYPNDPDKNKLEKNESLFFPFTTPLFARLIAEKGLRYDLTVPLARYVVQHQHELSFPFKRFHIGPVWRADRPQKGRYQEFYQCDADIIGSDSLLNEVELTMIYVEAFAKLGLDVTVKINNRKLIEAVLSKVGVSDKKVEVITIIDKYDKIGMAEVGAQLKGLGLGDAEVKQLHDLLFATNHVDLVKTLNHPDVTKEVETVMAYFGESPKVQFDASLMRGLDYYTGTIWEVRANGVQMGSIGGGGRYDNLTEMFGGQNLSGVGISFGIERIYDVMEELKLFPETISQGVKVLFVPRDASVIDFTFQQTQAVRQAGIAAEIFLGNVKKQKHFNYVVSKNIAFMVEVGENEQQSGKFRLREVKTRDTRNDLGINDIITILS